MTTTASNQLTEALNRCTAGLRDSLKAQFAAEAQLASALADKRRFSYAFIETEVMNVEAK